MNYGNTLSIIIFSRNLVFAIQIDPLNIEILSHDIFILLAFLAAVEASLAAC